MLANAIGETVGLGGTLVIGGLLLLNAQKTMGVVPAAALAVLAGTFMTESIVQCVIIDLS
jgi:hypothetical protein